MLLPSPSWSAITLASALTARLALAFSYDPALLKPQIPLAPSVPVPELDPDPDLDLAAPSEFRLQHIFHHGTYRFPSLHKRLDVTPDNIKSVTADDGLSFQSVPHLFARSRPITIERLVDRSVTAVEAHLAAARTDGYAQVLSSDSWTVDDVDGPDITDKESVLALAKMAANAYIMVPGTERWADVSGPFNHSQNFGWEDDGLRGHIYADEDNSTIVVSLKGTSTALFDGQGTTTNDKVNDNLFFSCCCGQGGSFLWRQVCDCATDTYTCNSTCLSTSLRAENRYYRAALDLYANVTSLYPSSNVWIVGHSLGGAISSMLGQTFGVPVVTFEAVPEALPSSRLGLPTPPGSDPMRPQKRKYSGAYHFGHTADPVYMGTCNSMTSVCTLAGYAMESVCHSGFRCVYDTVEDLGWRSGIGTHRILAVISDVIERYDDVPKCVRDTECVDCFNWKFFESNHSEPITSTKTRTGPPVTRTRTSTCKTPGWWGCLDPTTTTDASTTTADTTTTSSPDSTTTCHTPGWFGCRDPTTTVVTTTSTIPSIKPTTTTTSCQNPGWWGCRDPTATATPTQTSAMVTATSAITETLTPAPTATGVLPTSTFSMTSSVSSTSICLTPGRIYGCWDKPEATSSSSAVCKTPGWFWGCRDEPED